MSRFSSFTLLALALFQSGKATDEPSALGPTPFNGHRGEGYKIVDAGSITGCGTNTKQQCIQINPLENVSITVPEYVPFEKSGSNYGGQPDFAPVDVSCQPDGRCVTPFDFDRAGYYNDFLVNCLNYLGEDQGAYVHIYLGRGNVASTTDAYAYFVASGLDVKAKWENDDGFTSNNGVPRPSSMKGETLYIQCPKQI